MMRKLIFVIFAICNVVKVVHCLEKPGSCGRKKRGIIGGGLCVQKCSGDDSCPGVMKCCSNGCGRVCVPPVITNITKPGFCPQKTGPPNCEILCSSDGYCPGDQKCCSNGCGRVCRDPDIYTKPGFCPIEGAGQCFRRCSADIGCPGNQKCCGTCGTACYDPLDEKPGVCPKLRKSKSCNDECYFDGGCPDKLKCCKRSCKGGGLRGVCVDPIIITKPKPGFCPQTTGPPNCKILCSSDDSCPGDQKCCSNGCGYVCRDPDIYTKPGFCPIEGAGQCFRRCSADIGCPGNQKCCGTCGTACYDPLDEKPDVCPILQESESCNRECYFDGGCERHLKCCKQSCKGGGLRGVCVFPNRCSTDPNWRGDVKKKCLNCSCTDILAKGKRLMKKACKQKAIREACCLICRDLKKNK